MIEGVNFSGVDLASIPLDAEYRNCNFARESADLGPPVVGARLFPGDDTPRTFVRCNLVNCEPPPGSTLIQCNTTLLEQGFVVETDTVTVDGVTVASITIEGVRIHGRYNGSTEAYEYLPSPLVVEDKL